MRIVIDLPDYAYNRIPARVSDGDALNIYEEAIFYGKILPKGHGRLIDADSFKKKVCTYQQTGCGDCKHSLCCPEDAPTVIEADKTESEVVE